MNWKSAIPNGITLGNLLCGSISIYAVSQDKLVYASAFILFAAILDFFDGFAARALKVSGPLGTQLDSLADVISFGLAPSFIAAHLAGAFSEPFPGNYLVYIPFIMAPFAAFRLAKFNIDTEQSDSFKGLPTPANALFWLSIPLALAYSGPVEGIDVIIHLFASSPVLVGIAALFLGILMVSNIPLIALKFKTLDWRTNQWKYILVISAVLLLGVFGLASISIILLLYFVISFIHFQKN